MITKFSDCKESIIQLYYQRFHCEELDKIFVQYMEDPHEDVIGINGNILFYNKAYLGAELTEDECLACISHEIGHYRDKFDRKDDYLSKCWREFNADKVAIKNHQEKPLISALKKIDNQSLLTRMRIKVLGKCRNKNPLTPDSLIFALILEHYGFSAWDGKNHREADIIVNKNGLDYYFEIKETSAEKSCFGAATLTEWRCALDNEGRYFFVLVKKGSEDTLPQFIIYTPEEFLKFTTLPPFKFNFNINSLEEEHQNIEILCDLPNNLPKTKQAKTQTRKKGKGIHPNGKQITSLIQVYDNLKG